MLFLRQPSVVARSTSQYYEKQQRPSGSRFGPENLAFSLRAAGHCMRLSMTSSCTCASVPVRSERTDKIIWTLISY